MRILVLALTILLVYGGLHKRKKSLTKAVKSASWHYYGRFFSQLDCVKQCPQKLIEERREYDGTPESYMCMFSVSKVWHTVGVSRAFNCYYKNNVVKAYPNMNYTENGKYYGFEDGAYHDLDKCLAECKEKCWNEIDTNYYYCVWTSDENYN